MDYIMPEPSPRKTGADGSREVDTPRCNNQCVRNGLRRKDQAFPAGEEDAVVVVDCQGRIREWNAKAESLFGHPAGLVVGRNFFQLIAPHCFIQETDGAACHRRLGRTTGRVVNLLAKHLSGEDIHIEMQTFVGCTQEEGGALLVVRSGSAGGRDGRRRLAG